MLADRSLTVFAMWLYLALAGCRIQIQVPAVEGSVLSRSGEHDCSSGQTCEIVIDHGSGFSDTFTAVPEAGYYFRGWRSGNAFLCGGSVEACALENISENLTNNDFQAFLQPRFSVDNIADENRNRIRIVYAIPEDRDFNSKYAAAIENAVIDTQAWYANELSGNTLSLSGTSPTVCRLPNPGDYYLEDTMQRVWTDLQACMGENYHREFLSIIYADVIHGCNEDDFWRNKGAAGSSDLGYAMLTRIWLERLAEVNPISSPCSDSPPPPIYSADNSPVGALAHEMGHMLDLAHPLACEEGHSQCDYTALMYSGWASYPDTHLRPEEIERLLEHPAVQ
jgi:hypothetical protein